MSRHSFRKIEEKIFLAIITSLTALSILILLHIITTVFLNGIQVLCERGILFIIRTLQEGGIGPAIVGTLILIALSSIIGIPIAFLTGLYAYEFPDNTFGKIATILLQILLEFPTILIGVYIMHMVVIPMGSYSAIAGSIALALILMPYVATYTYEAMKQIPFTYREAAFSLGVSRLQAVFKILVPLSKRGILTGFLIAIAKVAGETAPLLFTIGGLYQKYPNDVFKQIGGIPLLIYTLIQSPSPPDHRMAWGASLVLLAIFLGVFIPVRLSLKEVKV